jgi:hypothetical protein
MEVETKFRSENLKTYLNNLDVHGRIILKWVFKTWSRRVCLLVYSVQNRVE